MVQSASALGAVFTAGHGDGVVVVSKPGGVGPAGVIQDTTALQLHKERTDRSEYN